MSGLGLLKTMATGIQSWNSWDYCINVISNTTEYSKKKNIEYSAQRPKGVKSREHHQ